MSDHHQHDHHHHGHGDPKQEQDQRITETLANVRYKFLVMSGKGGVGKSTVSVNLAVALARAGWKVGLMDVDLTGPSVPGLLGLDGAQAEFDGTRVHPIVHSENLKVLSIAHLIDLSDKAVIWRGPMKIGAIRQFLADIEWGDLDFMIIDCPPGTSDEPLTVAQTFTGVQAIVVTTPQEIALTDVRKSVHFCQKVNMPILGVIENLSGYTCPKCGHFEELFKTGGGEKLAAQFNVRFLGRLPIDPAVVRAGDLGEPYLALNADSATAKAFAQIADTIFEIAKTLPVERPGYTPIQFVTSR
ncbi:MAG: ATP-binding protein [Deltaproteobacteria bacterium]|nr:ATP-binding protein [Deltaproteobacteria bacterium]